MKLINAEGELSMYCGNCGTKIVEGSKFCGKCGAPIANDMSEITSSISSYGLTGDSGLNIKYVPDEGIVQTFLTTHGRLNRLRYFKRGILIAILSSLLGIVFTSPFSIPYCIISLVAMFPNYCIMVRRLHDIGHDNKIAIIITSINLVSIFVYMLFSKTPEEALSVSKYFVVPGMIIGLYLLFAKGVSGPNKYGPDPLG